MPNHEPLTSRLIEVLLPRQTALLVVDMQRYFVHPEYPFGKWIQQVDPAGATAYFERVQNVVIPSIHRLLERFRALGAQVVYTEFGSLRRDGGDMPAWARRHNDLARQVTGAAAYPPFVDPSCHVDECLAPESHDIIVQKSTSGPLNSTKLDQMLRVLGINAVVVAGVVTDVCVAQTAREFGDRDFNAIVVSDACATGDETTHRVTLDTIGKTFGTVLSTDEVLHRLEKTRSAD